MKAPAAVVAADDAKGLAADLPVSPVNLRLAGVWIAVLKLARGKDDIATRARTLGYARYRRAATNVVVLGFGVDAVTYADGSGFGWREGVDRTRPDTPVATAFRLAERFAGVHRVNIERGRGYNRAR